MSSKSSTPSNTKSRFIEHLDENPTYRSTSSTPSSTTTTSSPASSFTTSLLKSTATGPTFDTILTSIRISPSPDHTRAYTTTRATTTTAKPAPAQYRAYIPAPQNERESFDVGARRNNPFVRPELQHPQPQRPAPKVLALSDEEAERYMARYGRD